MQRGKILQYCSGGVFVYYCRIFHTACVVIPFKNGITGWHALLNVVFELVAASVAPWRGLVLASICGDAKQKRNKTNRRGVLEKRMNEKHSSGHVFTSSL